MPWMKDATGKPVWVDDAAPRTVPIGPQNPTFPYQGRKAAADLTGASLDNQGKVISNSRDAQMTPLDVQLKNLQIQEMAMKLEQARKEAEASNPMNVVGAGEVMRDAWSKLQDTAKARKLLNEGIAPTGSVFTPILRNIPGTAATDLVSISDRIAKSGALAKILEMTKATGKNPFTPMSNSDVQLIADTEGSASTNLSPEEYKRNLTNYEGAYIRAFAGASGAKALKNAVDAQFAKYVRENPNSTPLQRARFRSVLEEQANKNYAAAVERLNIGPGYASRKRTATANQPTAKFLGFEE